MTGLATTRVDTFDCRQAFAETLIELANLDPRIVAVRPKWNPLGA